MTALADLLVCLRFFSRLPVPATEREIALGAGGLAAAAAMAPLAGVVIALGPALALLAADALRLSPTTSAGLAIAFTVAVTGALHEDALADCADGFGGGSTPESKLAIMRDSRIGAYGAAALCLCLVLRIVALAGSIGAGRGVEALVVAAALSRAACLVPLVVLPPARRDGVGAATTGPGPARLAVAAALAAAVALVPAALGTIDPLRALIAIAAAFGGSSLVAALAARQIGGQTGDVAGAAQQVAEVAVLLVFAAGAG